MDHLRHPARMLLALATPLTTSAQTSAGCSVLQGLGSSCASVCSYTRLPLTATVPLKHYKWLTHLMQQEVLLWLHSVHR